MTKTLENTNFDHVLNLSDRVLEWKIAEVEATDNIKKLKARKAWYKLLNQMKLECLKKGIDYELFALDSFFEPQKRELTLGSVQTESDTPTCPVCDVEIPKGKKYCSNEHRYQYHNHKKRKND